MARPSEIAYIDLDKVIAAKSEKAAKYIPNFIKSYLKRLIHQDELNDLLDKSQFTEGLEFAKVILNELGVTYDIKYKEKSKIKKGGRYIFVSNHPLGGLDGLALITALNSNPTRFVVNDFLMHIKPLEKLFVPVNKVGSMGKGYLNSFEEAYSSDCDILYFPAGLCSRLINGEIIDLEWKSSFIKQALKYNREIVPVHFSGRNSTFFYRLAKFRKFAGIKFNIEMLFLPDEMFKQRGAHFNISVGEPIAVEKIKELREKKSAAEAADIIKRLSYSLAKEENR